VDLERLHELYWIGTGVFFVRGLVDDVYDEMTRAISKHGLEQTPANPNMSDLEKFVILSEEVGEVARALTYDEGGDVEHLRKELIQVAAMALMFAIGLENRRG
jgi:hypothetical protein